MVTGLNPADGPRLFAGYWRHKDPGTRSEVRRPVAQHHAGRLVDAGGVRVDGTVHLQDDDAVSETLGLTPDTLDAAHCTKQQHNPRQRPEVWRGKTHGHSEKIITVRPASRSSTCTSACVQVSKKQEKMACTFDPGLLSEREREREKKKTRDSEKRHVCGAQAFRCANETWRGTRRCFL